MGYKSELERLYVDYCKELSAYLKEPIEREEALTILNNYRENKEKEKVIGVNIDLETKEIIGFIIIYKQMIEQLYVQPKFRNSGKGRMILAAFLKMNREYELIILNGNPAIHFWEKVTADCTLPLTRNCKKGNDEERYYTFAL